MTLRTWVQVPVNLQPGLDVIPPHNPNVRRALRDMFGCETGVFRTYEEAGSG